MLPLAMVCIIVNKEIQENQGLEKVWGIGIHDACGRGRGRLRLQGSAVQGPHFDGLALSRVGTWDLELGTWRYIVIQRLEILAFWEVIGQDVVP